MNTGPGIMVVLLGLSLIMGCASNPYMSTGAALGGGIGALGGAAIANKNPWAGAAVGALAGGVLGGVVGEALRPKQASQPPPPRGYYYQPAPGYGAPPPPGRAYGYAPPPAGPSYGSAPPAGYSYSQNTSPQISGCRTPLSNAPYYY